MAGDFRKISVRSLFIQTHVKYTEHDTDGRACDKVLAQMLPEHLVGIAVPKEPVHGYEAERVTHALTGRAEEHGQDSLIAIEPNG